GRYVGRIGFRRHGGFGSNLAKFGLRRSLIYFGDLAAIVEHLEGDQHGCSRRQTKPARHWLPRLCPGPAGRDDMLSGKLLQYSFGKVLAWSGGRQRPELPRIFLELEEELPRIFGAA